MIMNTNGTNPGMNVEDYEDMAVQKSNVAKRVAAGAAIFAGGAAVAGGAAYAATHDDVTDEELSTEDLVEGADGPEEYKPQVEETQTTEKVVVHETVKPVVPDPEEPEMTWDHTTNTYVDGEKVMSVEEGTYQGHKFALYDYDGDDHADVFALDVNSNGQFEDNEIVLLSPEDHIHMGHETAQTTNQMYYDYDDPIPDPGPDPLYAHQEEIYNNFEDEKTGESYRGDFAENNPDYNPRAGAEDYERADVYLAENEKYDEGDNSIDEYESEDNYLAEADGYDNSDSIEENVDDPDMDLAEVDESETSDDLMGGEEFIG